MLGNIENILKYVTLLSYDKRLTILENIFVVQAFCITADEK